MSLQQTRNRCFATTMLCAGAAMLKRVAVGLGKALRDSGQALERMGMRAQDNWIFAEPFCRHRAVMNIYDQRPTLSPSVFVAPNASVIGNVEVKCQSSIWCVLAPHHASAF